MFFAQGRLVCDVEHWHRALLSVCKPGGAAAEELLGAVQEDVWVRSQGKHSALFNLLLSLLVSLSVKLMFSFKHWRENDNSDDIITIYLLTDTSEGVYLASRFSGKSPLWPFWTNFCNLNEQDHFLVNTLLKSPLKRLFWKQHLIFLGVLFYFTYVWVFWLNVCMPTTLEWVVLSYHVGSGNWNQVL